MNSNNDNNENNENNDSNNNNKNLLKKKRKAQFSLEEIINIYCKQHNIKDNEITEKIKTIYYHNPEQNILINYNKENGDKFPLSHHIHKNKKQILFNEDDIDEKEEKQNEKDKDKNKDNNQEEGIIKEKDEEKKEEKCFICGWTFLKELSFEEINRHINLCLEGKGEENKKELISTYKELENLAKNQNQEQNNENNNEEKEAENNKGEEGAVDQKNGEI